MILSVGARASRRAGAPPRDRRRVGALPPDTGRATWRLWAGSFCLVAGILVIRNAFLFRVRLHELADYADDSILIEQARRLELLVGNYSREHFSHPGPAYLYVQAAGEWLFWSVLHWVPTAWNGQLLATIALNASAAACIPLLCARWSEPGRGATTGGLAGLAVVLGFAAVHPSAFSLNWMPYLYVPMYFAFLVAVASVAAGRVGDSPVAATAGWFLMEGHACFLLLVPLAGGVAVAALARAVRQVPPLQRLLAGGRAQSDRRRAIRSVVLVAGAARLGRGGRTVPDGRPRDLASLRAPAPEVPRRAAGH